MFGRFKKNYSKLLDEMIAIVNRAIIEAQETLWTNGDVFDLINDRLDGIIANSTKEIEAWNKRTDFKMYAHKLLYSVCFDTLSSGELHVFRGVLDETKPIYSLYKVIDICLDYYVEHGLATKEQAEDQKEILKENIAEVG